MLHHDVIPAKGGELSPRRRWLYLLHGIFGAGRNWRSIGRGVSSAAPAWGAVAVDLRLHGDSPAMAPPHTVSACASDLQRLADRNGLVPAAVLGHSFGGKVALAHLHQTPEGVAVPEQVWIMDSTPAARAPAGNAVRMLRAVRALPKVFDSRAQVVSGLEEAGFAPGVARWMSSNIRRADGGFVWKLDFDALEELLDDFFRADLWSVVERPPDGVSLHFVRATRSEVMTDSEAERIREIGRHAAVHLHAVEGGHWLNADNPAAVLELLLEYLSND